MTAWQWIAAGWLFVTAVFTGLCVCGFVTDTRNERDRREARRRPLVDELFAELTDPAHFDKTGNPT